MPQVASPAPARLRASETIRINWIVSMAKQVDDCVIANDRDGLLKLAAEYATHIHMTDTAKRTKLLADKITGVQDEEIL